MSGLTGPKHLRESDDPKSGRRCSRLKKGQASVDQKVRYTASRVPTLTYLDRILFSFFLLRASGEWRMYARRKGMIRRGKVKRVASSFSRESCTPDWMTTIAPWVSQRAFPDLACQLT